MPDFDWTNAAKPEASFDWSSAHEPEADEPPPAAAPAPKLNAVDQWAEEHGLAKPIRQITGAVSAAARFNHEDFDKALEDRQDPGSGDTARAALQGATLGHGGAAIGYGPEFHDAAAEHPYAQLAGSFAVPLPGVGKLKALKGAAGVAARMGANGLIGAGIGAASGDTEMSLPARAGVGFGAGVLGGAASEGIGAIASKATKKVAGAIGDAANSAKTAVDDEIRSAVGSHRSAIQSASRDLEVIEREAAGGNAAAQKFLQSPEAKAIKDMVLKTKLETAPERIAEVAEKGQAAKTLRSGAQQAVVDKTDEMLANPMRTQVIPRVARMAQHSIPPMVGGAVGGLPGAAVGAATAGVMGNPGRTISNMMRSPGVRKMVWGTVQTLAETAPEKLGPYGAVIARELETSPEHALALHSALAEHDPDYQKRLEEIQGQDAYRQNQPKVGQ